MYCYSLHVALVEQLLMKMDRELYDYLHSMDMGLMFCHRWLLLNFKREFDYMEAVRLFEITSSRHLEVSSVEAKLERSKERAKEFVKDSKCLIMEQRFGIFFLIEAKMPLLYAKLNLCARNSWVVETFLVV